jgi:hypothetical protein
VDHIDAGHHLEQLARNVAPGAGTPRRHVETSWRAKRDLVGGGSGR